MEQSLMEQMPYEKRYLVSHSMADMDLKYDGEAQMIRSSPEQHSTRGSAHYALGLLLRNGSGDREKACRIIQQVIDMQFDAPDEIYHGTYRTSPQAALPPAGNYDWKAFAPGFAYFLDSSFEKIAAKLADLWTTKALSQQLDRLDKKTIKNYFRTAVDQVLPPVWKSYDPNWREFIACTFAVILDQFESALPFSLVARMDESIRKAVGASIDRRLADAIPMNSNIELMHIFITHYFGHRYGNEDWTAHADKQARSLLTAYQEFGSLAEFNSTTYYGVDLTTLGLWRTYGKSDAFKQIGHEMERGLWENIALFYHPQLENLSGPFARAYEMDMLDHSSIGVFLFLALGKDYEHLAGINCESGHDPMIALVGADVPRHLLPSLISHQADRLAVQKFRELCERDKPGANSNLCTAVAWIENDLMIGAMSGSKNTNGQMHPATIHWQTGDGNKYYLRLLRRETGDNWNTHLRGITFEAKAEKDRLSVDIELNTDLEIDVYFEISGSHPVHAEGIAYERWTLPGLTLSVEAEAPAPTVVPCGGKVEVIYRYRPGVTKNRMSFILHRLTT